MPSKRIKCLNCGKLNTGFANYCPNPDNWAENWRDSCHIQDALKAGAKIHLPNNLPPTCVGSMILECEHGDHPDYKYPVMIEYTGKETSEYHEYDVQQTALIYNDVSIALVMFEACYSMFSLRDGIWLGGKLFDKDWKLTQSSLEKIKGIKCKM